jgi:histidinol-phosphate/aromatic aminotransferase/cobyric acid decarboxylase-like protein
MWAQARDPSLWPDPCPRRLRSVAPEVFAVEDVAIVIGAGSDEAILEAARACPAGAIAVIDPEPGNTVYR